MGNSKFASNIGYSGRTIIFDSGCSYIHLYQTVFFVQKRFSVHLELTKPSCHCMGFRKHFRCSKDFIPIERLRNTEPGYSDYTTSMTTATVSDVTLHYYA